MKTFRNIIILVIISFSFITNVDAAKNPYGKTQDLYGAVTVRCTWYAWEQAYQNTGVALPNLGNAQDWYDNAKKAGYSVGKTAKPKSIAVWSSTDGYGHVGYVVSVNGELMTTNEGGLLTTVPDYCNVESEEICGYKSAALNGDGIANGASRYTTADNIIGYIYLTEGKTANNNTTNKTTTKSQSNNEETTTNKTDNNAYLKDLTIDSIIFTFDKEQLEYNFEVNYKTRIISITATAESSEALISGIGKKTLTMGENLFPIKVTASDGTEKEYLITITRMEKEKSEEITNDQEVNFTPIILIGLGILAIVIITLTIIIFRKRK